MAYVTVNGQLQDFKRFIEIDGMRAGVDHRIHAELEGFVPFDTTIVLRAGREESILIKLVRAGTP